ncbi:hypothetical protein SAMN05421665_1754 [Yoonia rosea]|uniref:Uncharacterized protein n=1 Tax=Yoonia rosea TaxID=287098 RepID=A0A1R3X081_9RHOB|nr:hypothetical protein [Yoonia rosea]SIT83930.1 hypothetical protein SAMN05421665_1754 [Yoonia rosea]
MCVKVGFTAGCTFADVAEATKAAAAAAPVGASADCVSVAFTAGCTFSDIAEAQAAAKPHLDAFGSTELGCGNVLFTAVCSV